MVALNQSLNLAADIAEQQAIIDAGNDDTAGTAASKKASLEADKARI